MYLYFLSFIIQTIQLFNDAVQSFSSDFLKITLDLKSRCNLKIPGFTRYIFPQVPARYSRRIISERDEATMPPLSFPPFLPCISPTRQVGYPTPFPRPGQCQNSLAQYEGMGTLHGPNSQPRYDLAPATYLHKPRARTWTRACT